MNKLESIYIVTHAPKSSKNDKPMVDVEFHRRHSFKEFNDVSSQQFRRVCKALKGMRVSTSGTDNDSLIVQFMM